MKALLNQFKSYLQEIDSSPETVKAYTSDTRKFAKWYSETTGTLPDMYSVGPLDIAEFKRYLMNKNQKPATINRAVISLSALFKYLDIPNPAKDIKLLQEVKAAPKSLNRKELLALIRSVRASGKIRDIAIVTLLLHTGIRVSELCALNTDDIVLRERSGTVTIRSGKGNKRRRVPLNSTVRNALNEWLDTRENNSKALFNGKGSNSLSTRAIGYLLEKYSYRAGLEKVTPHVLRHTFCKSLIDAGESLDRVATLAGHENLNTTARYTRATGKDLQRAVERLAWE